MVDYSDDFNEHSDSLRVKREAADFDDLNHAMSGTEVGRQRKHIPNNHEIDPITGEKKRDGLEEFLQQTLAQLLASNEQYRLRHENLISSLQDTAEFTQSTLERIVSELVGERSAIDKLLFSAAKLSDGRKVFKDKHSNVRNEDGAIIPPELASKIEWAGNEPTYEEYVAQKNRIAELEIAEREIRGIETELGGIRGDVTNNEKPLTPQQQGTVQKQTDALKERVQKIEADVLKITNEHIIADQKITDEISESVPNIKQIPMIKVGS